MFKNNILLLKNSKMFYKLVADKAASATQLSTVGYY